MDLVMRRRFYAEEIEAVANVRTTALREALAAVPRERFLPPGPWFVRGEGDSGGARQTPDADPRHLYHNVSVAIDLQRQLFNGAPSILATLIDALAIKPGARVLHIGPGLGYYSAVMAHMVGSAGRVTAVEVDEALAGQARANLAALPWVEVEVGNGTERLTEAYDAILVNAGVTHPQDAWLDGLAPDGRLVIPLTATMPAMGPVGKGVTVLVTATAGGFDARVLTMVAIYSAIGLRDDALNAQVGQALMRGPFPSIKRLRRDRHDPDASCWLHTPASCLSRA